MVTVIGTCELTRPLSAKEACLSQSVKWGLMFNCFLQLPLMWEKGESWGWVFLFWPSGEPPGTAVPKACGAWIRSGVGRAPQGHWRVMQRVHTLQGPSGLMSWHPVTQACHRDKEAHT